MFSRLTLFSALLVLVLQAIHIPSAQCQNDEFLSEEERQMMMQQLKQLETTLKSVQDETAPLIKMTGDMLESNDRLMKSLESSLDKMSAECKLDSQCAAAMKNDPAGQARFEESLKKLKAANQGQK
jgi:hypothetical protein